MNLSPSADADFREQLRMFYRRELHHTIDDDTANTIIIHRLESFSLAYDRFRETNADADQMKLVQIATEAAEMFRRFSDPSL